MRNRSERFERLVIEKTKELNHPTLPKTRREFLAMGLTASAGYFCAPTFMRLLGKTTVESRALAAENANRTPFIVIDCAGGPSLSGNFLVGGQGGPEDLLTSYSRLGWNPRNAAYSKEYGLPIANSQVSFINRGIMAATTAEARANFRMASICHFSGDDTSNNYHSALVEVAREGLKGSLLGSGLSTRQGPFGGNTMGPNKVDALRPLNISGPDGLKRALGGSGVSWDKYSLQERENLLKSISGLLSESSNPAVRKAFEDAQNTILQKINVDPRQDASSRLAFGLSETTPEGPQLLQATVVYNALMGYTGPCAIEIRGCDYHDGGQSTGDNKDQEIGTLVGRVVQLAFLLKKPVMIQLLADGSTASVAGSRAWQSDSGNKNITVLGFYQPEKAPELTRFQLGHFKGNETDQGVERSTWIGDNTALVARAVTANYLRFSGTKDIREIAGKSGLSQAQVESALGFWA